ncbi:hypothetical protein fugu_019957 [Takifugu bimaculatus]|uniref:Uncharacterized protein n=1 Tax=Takifugu bimaculatus TaxID=433685 RepID=A0A4Z2BIK1_9TELE|nr:hypothetical protein fugu_019957 [Takifugu bimaculatus]
MPVVERRRAAAPQWGNGPSRHQDFRHHRQPLALPGRPVGTWPPGGSCSARHEHGEPFYMSFVSKAILWDRRLRHYPARERPYDCPSLCPRFLSHMKVHPEDHRPQCFQTSKSRRPPLFQGRTTNTCTLAPPDAKAQTLESEAYQHNTWCFHTITSTTGGVPSAPPPSTFNPTPPLQNTPFLNSEGQQVKVDSDGASPNNTHPPVDENIKAQTKEAPVSLMESMKLHLKSSGPVCSPSPPSTLSQGSSSDYSQAPSSVFSRSTNLSGWISGLSGCCSSASSRSSELSCTQSHLFDELEAIAPRSPSCPSLYQPWDSPRSASPDTELSPGLAALTVGCQSGNLSSMSRVQLLLLKRVEPEDEEPSPSQDWSGFRMQYDAGLTSSGAPRPLTAGSVSERCDPARRAVQNKSDESGSPSSWIMEQRRSFDTFRSTVCSPCGSSHGSRRRCHPKDH